MKDMANVTLEQVLEERGLIAKWKARGAQEAEQKWEATQQKWEAERREWERQKQETERQKQELERKLRQYESVT
jgi:hypothetical protein